MSTRCTINFCYGEAAQVAAKIYRHSDGYSDTEHGVLADLQRFFEAVTVQTQDTRFGDPAYLAAKYVVWQAHENAVSYEWCEADGDYKTTPKKPLDFLSLGILMKDPGDIEFTYFVDCTESDEQGFPVVNWRKAPLG